MHFDASDPDPVSDTAHNVGFLVFVIVTPPLDSDLSGGLSYWPESLFRIFRKERVAKRRQKAI